MPKGTKKPMNRNQKAVSKIKRDVNKRGGAGAVKAVANRIKRRNAKRGK